MTRSDIYYPVMCFAIYFDRPVIYTPSSCVSPSCFPFIHTRSCLSRNSLSACIIFKSFKHMLETTLPVSYTSVITHEVRSVGQHIVKREKTGKVTMTCHLSNIKPRNGGIVCHVFRDLLWQITDIYSPVMCFGIYFERPVIYTPRHVFRNLLWQASDIYSLVMCFALVFSFYLVCTRVGIILILDFNRVIHFINDTGKVVSSMCLKDLKILHAERIFLDKHDRVFDIAELYLSGVIHVYHIPLPNW
jgi:hypothetical protein